METMLKKQLTEREKEVLLLIVLGKSNNEIGQILAISYYTAKAHVSSILYKLEVPDRLNATIKAIKLGLVKI